MGGGGGGGGVGGVGAGGGGVGGGVGQGSNRFIYISKWISPPANPGELSWLELYAMGAANGSGNPKKKKKKN